MVWLCKAVLKPREHGHLFCTALQFEQWYWALSKESDEEEIVPDDGEQVMQKMYAQVGPVFDVESTFLEYTLALETYHENPSVWNAKHTIRCEHPLHFWRAGVSWKGVLGTLEYQGYGEIQTTHL